MVDHHLWVDEGFLHVSFQLKGDGKVMQSSDKLSFYPSGICVQSDRRRLRPASSKLALCGINVRTGRRRLRSANVDRRGKVDENFSKDATFSKAFAPCFLGPAGLLSAYPPSGKILGRLRSIPLNVQTDCRGCGQPPWNLCGQTFVNNLG